jgi:hypothetical protein
VITSDEKDKKDRRYKSDLERKSYDIHVRLCKDDYAELRVRATSNNMKMNQYIRNTIFSDRYRIINTDYDLFFRLGRAIDVLTRTGNYLVKLGKFLENNEDYKDIKRLKEGFEAEKLALKELRKLIISYQRKTDELEEQKNATSNQ